MQQKQQQPNLVEYWNTTEERAAAIINDDDKNTNTHISDFLENQKWIQEMNITDDALIDCNGTYYVDLNKVRQSSMCYYNRNVFANSIVITQMVAAAIINEGFGIRDTCKVYLTI